MIKNMTPCVALAFVACGADTTPTPSVPPSPGTALVLTTDYATSTMDRFEVGAPTIDHGLLVASGDAGIRRSNGRVAIINRGVTGSLVLLDHNLSVEGEISLAGCNPHDVEFLAGDRALVTCYDEAVARTVDLAARQMDGDVDLSAFVVVGPSPEMDFMARVGNRLFITLELLDLNYSPMANGKLVELDATTLAVVDDYDLPCKNPFTEILVSPDDKLLVGCAGDYIDSSVAGVASFDLTTNTASMVADGSALGSGPWQMTLAADGTPYVVVYDGLADEMKVIEASATPRVLHSVSGFNLSGIAVGSDDRIYVGNRSTNPDETGIWSLDRTTGQGSRVHVTSLPPFEIEIF